MRIIRQAEVSDIDGIKALLKKYHKDTISDEDRPNGFVTMISVVTCHTKAGHNRHDTLLSHNNYL